MMLRGFFLLVATIATVVGQLPKGSANDSSSSTFKIFQTKFYAPEISGFVEISEKIPKLFSFTGKNFTIANNRLIAQYIPLSDMELIHKNTNPNLDRHFLVQTMRASERQLLSRVEFEQIKKLTKEQFNKGLKSFEPKVNEELNKYNKQISSMDTRKDSTSLPSIKFGDTYPISYFSATPYSCSFIYLFKKSNTKDGITEEIPVVSSTTNVLCKGKVIFFYAYSIYNSSEDIDWVKKVTTEWINNFESINQPNP